MKCGYGDHCKLGKEVGKLDAVKQDKKYYHKSCLHEKETKTQIVEYFRQHFNKNEPSKNIYGALSKYLNENNFEIDYILFCLKNKAKSLNSMYGLIYSLSNPDNYKEYKRIEARKFIINLGDYSESSYNEAVVTESKKQATWGDVFG